MESQELRVISQALIQRLDVLIQQQDKLLIIFEDADKQDTDEDVFDELDTEPIEVKQHVRPKED
jgi:hypothetical protein